MDVLPLYRLGPDQQNHTPPHKGSEGRGQAFEKILTAAEKSVESIRTTAQGQAWINRPALPKKGDMRRVRANPVAASASYARWREISPMASTQDAPVAI